MNSYFYLKLKGYPRGEYEVVTRGTAPSDELALSLAQEDEIVVRQVEEQQPMREDAKEIARAKEQREKDEAEAKAAGITREQLTERRIAAMYEAHPELRPQPPAKQLELVTGPDPRD